MIHFPTLNDPASKCNTHAASSDLPSGIQHSIPPHHRQHLTTPLIPFMKRRRFPPQLPNLPPPPRPISQIAALPPPSQFQSSLYALLQRSPFSLRSRSSWCGARIRLATDTQTHWTRWFQGPCFSCICLFLKEID